LVAASVVGVWMGQSVCLLVLLGRIISQLVGWAVRWVGGLVGRVLDLLTLEGVAWIHKPGCGFSRVLVQDTLLSKESK